MLPFSTIDFFFLFAALFMLLLAVKQFLSSLVPFRSILLFITFFYLIFFFPKPLTAFLFVSYCYGIYYVFDYVLKIRNKLWGSICLALPMILVKAAFQPDLLSFAGLSYITFRVIQIYLDNSTSNKPVDIFNFFLFMLFPATLLIGPIDRYGRFVKDLESGYQNLNVQQLVVGWESLMLGVLQKFVVAEFINRYWLSTIDADSKNAADMFNYMYAYSVYLYFDFAGYSSLAVGLGKMLGINVPDNFNLPFLAVNPPDFWKRWHITLGDWLKDYIFRPYYKWISGKLSLKNYPLFKQNSGMFLTFFIMGLWNGFSANFILSGSLFGMYSVVHNTYTVQCRKKGKDIIFGEVNPVIIKCISIFIMFNIVCFALYIFSGKFPFM